MKCRKCKSELPEGSKYCNMCGAKVAVERKPKSRGNGTGTVYKRGANWIAVIVTGFELDSDNKMHRKTRSKGGFKTKREALEYIPTLKLQKPLHSFMRRGCLLIGLARIQSIATKPHTNTLSPCIILILMI